MATKPEEERGKREASIERNASSRAKIAAAVSADLISALLTASSSRAAAFQVLAHSRFENAVLAVTDGLGPLNAVGESEEGSLGMI
jgi:hypothetical protein